MTVSPRVRFVVFALACAVVAYLSLIPKEELPPTGISDRVHHLVAYGLLALIGAWTFRARMALAAGLVLYGIAIELLQGAMDLGRHADVIDGLANTLGVLLGLAIALVAGRRR